MCIYMYIYQIYTYIHVCIHTYIHAYIYIHIRVLPQVKTTTSLDRNVFELSLAELHFALRPGISQKTKISK